ncbi:MAG TPA: hypothetical protein VK116_03440, partial [Planctomycetota bacterium]|nr:hypothetical protein [Planctomycetota bacterium]
MRQYDYAYHAAYGSPKIDEKLIDVRKVTVSKDGLEVRLGVELAAGRVFELRPHGIRSRDGAALATRMAAYTVNRLRSREGGSADGARRDGAPEQRVESSER